jgi:hypothetical protein
MASERGRGCGCVLRCHIGEPPTLTPVLRGLRDFLPASATELGNWLGKSENNFLFCASCATARRNMLIEREVWRDKGWSWQSQGVVGRVVPHKLRRGRRVGGQMRKRGGGLRDGDAGICTQ